MIEIITTYLNQNNQENNYKKIFLGEWCIPFNSKSKLIGLNKVLNYHWASSKKSLRDFKYINKLHKSILPDLANKLNLIHNKKINKKEWNLIIGYWLYVYISVCVDRYNTISNLGKKLEKEKDYFVKEFHNLSKDQFIPIDTSEAVKFFHDDLWNHLFFSDLLRLFTKVNFRKTTFKYLSSTKVNSHFKLKLFSLSFIKIRIKNFLKNFLKLSFSKRKLIYLLNPEISLINIFKLKFFTKSVIILNPDLTNFYSNNPKYIDRNWFLPFNENDDALIKFVKQSISQWLPKSFMENFDVFYYAANKFCINKKADLIFSSNIHHDGCDEYKILSAIQIKKGAKFVLGQHGGQINKYNVGTEIERNVADILFSNGWFGTDGKKIINVGQYWHRLKKNQFNPLGNALLVTGLSPKYSLGLESKPLSSLNLSYFKDLYSFYGNLEDLIKKEVKVRIYPKADYGWDQKNRWLDKFPDVQLDYGSFSLSREVRRSRILISTYNASTYLESLAANIPTIIFWDQDLWPVPMECEVDFKKLNEVGIFFDSPIEAANQINKIWDNVYLWWKNEYLQEVRKDFCSKYSCMDSYKIKRFGVHLKDLLN